MVPLWKRESFADRIHSLVSPQPFPLHPHVATLWGATFDSQVVVGGTVGLVEQWGAGDSVEAWLAAMRAKAYISGDDGVKLQLKTVLRILLGAALGLKHFHVHGIW